MAASGGVITFKEIHIFGEPDNGGYFIPHRATLFPEFTPDIGEKITLAPITITVTPADQEQILEEIQKMIRERNDGS